MEVQKNEFVDYENAHMYLSLSEDDKREIDEWLQTLFPDGVDALSDDQLISAIYNELRNSDSFSYEYDITENWESMAQFLQTRTGDCEEFTQLFFHAIQAAYEQMPARDQPELSILAGTVGSGFYESGHSVVLVSTADEQYIIDLTNGPTEEVGALSDFLTEESYTETFKFKQLVQFDKTDTELSVHADELIGFSTASDNINDAINEKFKSLMGSDDDISDIVDDDSYLEGDGIKWGRDIEGDYEVLIRKIIAIELDKAAIATDSSGTKSVYGANLEKLEELTSGFETLVNYLKEIGIFYVNDDLTVNAGGYRITDSRWSNHRRRIYDWLNHLGVRGEKVTKSSMESFYESKGWEPIEVYQYQIY